MLSLLVARLGPVLSVQGSSKPDRGRMFLETLSRWQERARERRILAALDDRMLKDIGVSRGLVQEEIDKPFWRE